MQVGIILNNCLNSRSTKLQLEFVQILELSFLNSNHRSFQDKKKQKSY